MYRAALCLTCHRVSHSKVVSGHPKLFVCTPVCTRVYLNILNFAVPLPGAKKSLLIQIWFKGRLICSLVGSASSRRDFHFQCLVPCPTHLIIHMKSSIISSWKLRLTLPCSVCSEQCGHATLHNYWLGISPGTWRMQQQCQCWNGRWDMAQNNVSTMPFTQSKVARCIWYLFQMARSFQKL